MLRSAVLAALALGAAALLAPVPPAVAGECLAASAVNEPDIRRNARVLAGSCIRRHEVREDGRRWRFYEITQGMPGPLFAVLHDNENAAFDAAARALGKYGGTILAVEAGERRMFRGKDPNRNFGTKCGDARRYTKFVMGRAKAHPQIVAMHSNARGFKGDGKGGKGHINVYRKSKVLQGRPAPNARGALRSGDNFVLVPAKSERDVERRIRVLHRQGAHAMFERVTRKGDDCSMSNYAVLNGMGPAYVNVEVRHGQRDTALKLVRKAMTVFR